jgi:hypothetical protein
LDLPKKKAIDILHPVTERVRGSIMSVKMPKNLGILLLATWLILFGILTAPFLRFSFAYSADVRAILGIAAGVVLLLKR